eukprot:254332-Pleurochrysis_carterae.AAC.3
MPDLRRQRMANATDFSLLHSVARCPRTAHAPASTQSLRGSAVGPLPLPRPSRSRLHPLALNKTGPVTGLVTDYLRNSNRGSAAAKNLQLYQLQ